MVDFIKRYSAKYGYPPTVRDIGKAVGLASSSTVHAHLANLEKLGLLRRDPSKPRAIELLGRVRDELGGAVESAVGAAGAGEEATVKRFFREADHIRLQPENAAMEPILSTDVRVLGRVVGLFRSVA